MGQAIAVRMDFTIYRALKDLGFSHVSARPRPPTKPILTPWRRSKKLCRTRGGNPRQARAGHTDRGLVPGRDANRQKNKFTYRWARKGARVPKPLMISAPNRHICSGAVCPEHGTGAALVLPFCNTEAMDERGRRRHPSGYSKMTLAVRHKDDARETSAERQCPTPLCFRRTAQIGNPEPSSPGVPERIAQRSMSEIDANGDVAGRQFAKAIHLR